MKPQKKPNLTNDPDRWVQGYACAVANMLSKGGDDTWVIELYREGIGDQTEAQLMADGVDEYDINLFKKYNLLTT